MIDSIEEYGRGVTRKITSTINKLATDRKKMVSGDGL